MECYFSWTSWQLIKQPVSALRFPKLIAYVLLWLWRVIQKLYFCNLNGTLMWKQSEEKKWFYWWRWNFKCCFHKKVNTITLSNQCFILQLKVQWLCIIVFNHAVISYYFILKHHMFINWLNLIYWRLHHKICHYGEKSSLDWNLIPLRSHGSRERPIESCNFQARNPELLPNLIITSMLAKLF